MVSRFKNDYSTCYTSKIVDALSYAPFRAVIHSPNWTYTHLLISDTKHSPRYKYSHEVSLYFQTRYFVRVRPPFRKLRVSQSPCIQKVAGARRIESENARTSNRPRDFCLRIVVFAKRRFAVAKSDRFSLHDGTMMSVIIKDEPETPNSRNLIINSTGREFQSLRSNIIIAIIRESMIGTVIRRFNVMGSHV